MDGGLMVWSSQLRITWIIIEIKTKVAAKKRRDISLKWKKMRAFCWIYFHSYCIYNLHLSMFPILSRSKLKILDMELYEEIWSVRGKCSAHFFPQVQSMFSPYFSRRMKIRLSSFHLQLESHGWFCQCFCHKNS